MKTLQDYIDKLKALNFKEMYEGDFFLTWEKTDDELEAVWIFPYSAIILPVHVSLLLLHVICLVWKFRIWTKASLRLPMARLYAKQLT